MPIAFSCQSCSRALRVKDELAGKQIYCPDCKSILIVPVQSEATRLRPEDDIPTAAVAEPEARDPYGMRAEEPAKPLTRRPTAGDDDFPTTELPRRRTAPPPRSSGGDSGGGIGAVIGGIVMMVIAVVWFVVGWMAGRIFFYPPILFIIGIVAVIRGIIILARGSD